MQGKISYEGLRSDATSIETNATNMKKALDAADTEMKKINSDDSWKSDAANEMYNKFQTLAKRFSEFENAVKSYAKFLKETANAYEAADKKIKEKENELLQS